MRRTKTPAAQESPIDADIETGYDSDSVESTDTSVKPTSFNGFLVQFQYSAADVASSQNCERRVAQSPSVVSPCKRTQDASSTGAIASPSKKRRKSSKYAPPSTYSHLPKLTDIFAPNLICIFIGTNPGIQTATVGHAYAHPSNLFWKLLHASGLTDRRCAPAEDVDMPRLYAMGNTNIVERPSRDAAELSKAEMEAGARVLESKMRRWKPEAVCIVGKGIWEAIVRARYGKGLGKDFEYGWQGERENMGKSDEQDWPGSRVFVTTTTSRLSVWMRLAEKEAIWKPFGEWVRKRRLERFGKDGEGNYLEALWAGKEDFNTQNSDLDS